eukprot:3399512-Lingulodinium_polyedra.AAC.1
MAIEPFWHIGGIRHTRCFGGTVNFYRCHSMSLTEKLQKFCSRVQVTVLHGVGGWAWNEEMVDRLRRWEGARRKL